jgi:hypothetical protein
MQRTIKISTLICLVVCFFSGENHLPRSSEKDSEHLLTLCINSFLQFPPEGEGKRWRHRIANLPVLALDVARELVVVRKALRSRTFTDCDDPILVRVEAHANLAHWLGVCHRSREIALPIQPTIKPFPLVVPFSCVRQAPRDQVHQLAR